MSWGMSSDLWLHQILHSSNRSPIGYNAGYAADSTLDALLNSACREVDPIQRMHHYRAADARVMQTLPILPLLSSRRGMLGFSPCRRSDRGESMLAGLSWCQAVSIGSLACAMLLAPFLQDTPSFISCIPLHTHQRQRGQF